MGGGSGGGASGPPAGMMGGGMGGGMGGMGGGGGGGQLAHSETEPPEHLRLTYSEFLVKEGAARIDLPDVYLTRDDGEPKQYTASQWTQLGRIYREGGAVAEVKRGTPGGGLADRLQAEVEHIAREHLAVEELYEYATTNCFSATVGLPQLGVVTHEAEGADVRMNVVIHSTKTFPDKAARRLKPLSKEGSPWREGGTPGGLMGATAGRGRLDIVTKGGGYTQPVKLYLDEDAIQTWNDLWSDTEIRVSLLDNTGGVLAETTASVGLDGSVCEQMVFPVEAFDHTSVHQMPDVSPYGTDLPLFSGGSKSLYEIKGWLIGGAGGMSFSLQAGPMAALSGAQVELLPAGGLAEVLLCKVTR